MANTRSASSRAGSSAPESPVAARPRRRRPPRPAAAASSSPSPSPSPPPRRRWHHAPTRATLLWMAASLPLVVWDTAYVLGRPHTMQGGALHWPLWVPYDLYGRVDHIYGWHALNARNGFTGAQAFLNLVETAMYLAYLWLCYARRAPGPGVVIQGRPGAFAVLLAFSAAVMTLSKTTLYWMNEYYSGFANIGHNPFVDLIYLWIIPNGAWLVGSAFMVWSLGGDILDGLETASARAKPD